MSATTRYYNSLYYIIRLLLFMVRSAASWESFKWELFPHYDYTVAVPVGPSACNSTLILCHSRPSKPCIICIFTVESLYKNTPEMRTFPLIRAPSACMVPVTSKSHDIKQPLKCGPPPLIRTVYAVPRVSGIEGFHNKY